MLIIEILIPQISSFRVVKNINNKNTNKIEPEGTFTSALFRVTSSTTTTTPTTKKFEKIRKRGT